MIQGYLLGAFVKLFVRFSVDLFARNNSAQIVEVFMKSDIWVLLEMCRGNCSFIKFGQ
jgi:hypothetical protein